MRKIERKLLDRLREQEREKRRRYASASLWEGEYGYGPGKAHPSVEFSTCPHCGSVPGRLCIGDRGPKFGIHYARSRAFRQMKRDVYAKLAAELEKERS